MRSELIMKLYAKRNFVVFVAFPAGFIFIALMAVYIKDVLGFLIFPYVIIIEYFSRRFICPNCNTPLGWHKYKIFGFSFMWWSPLSPKTCEHCDFDFRKE